jgi:DNA polymerase I-like protein with 3'-5' exonuclease and polymerase domains
MLRLSERMGSRRLGRRARAGLSRIELPLIEVLASMELAGIAIDRAEFEAMSIELEADSRD